MFDPDAPSSRLAVEQIETEGVEDRLFSIARKRTGSDADADDLLEEALVRVLDPDDAPWDPSRGAFTVHMAHVMRQTWTAKLRGGYARREVPDDGLDRSPLAPSKEVPADVELDHRRGVARFRSLLEEVLAKIGDKHPRARQIADLACRGVDDPGEQARALQCPVDEVYRALETLKYHAKAALDERELADRRRMENLREAAVKRGEVIP